MSAHETILRPKRLEGVRLRDEFICPITYELLREPVVAQDGYTYERAAIEKWFLSRETSPLTSVLVTKMLTPNLTLKKLIQDLINEGATGLYTKDSVKSGRMVDIYAERFLNFKCVGPPEARDWYRQSFQATPRGCVGGRRPNYVDNSIDSKDIILFRDTTVSRRHFEIVLSSPGQYSIRDLGSAGGTFVRILFGKRKELLQGMIIMLGKHQFIVSSLDENSEGEPPATTIVSLLKHAEVLADEISGFPTAVHEVESRLKSITTTLKKVEMMSRAAAGSSGPTEAPAEAKSLSAEFSNSNSNSNNNNSSKAESKGNDASGLTQNKGCDDSVTSEDKEDDDSSLATCMTPTASSPRIPNARGGASAGEAMGSNGDGTATVALGYAHRRCVLTCCAPEGSPLVGRNFPVGSEGGTLGREPDCDVPLCRILIDSNGDTMAQKLDAAISAEHARIEMDPLTGRFFISDGAPSKPSTNGTWFRLSGPAQESAPYKLSDSDELLFGTLRFQIRESMTISESVVEGSPAKHPQPACDAKGI